MQEKNFALEVEYWAAEDSITLYWERPDGSGGCGYQVCCDNALVGETDKTHFTLNGLEAEREYHISVNSCGGGKDIAEEYVIRTPARRRRIDVTQAPYYAAGDGTAMDTKALQDAIDSCGGGECVYLPRGVYLTGALRLHSGMELYLDEGAVLQGTDNPEDYLPRIHSRFEGTEMECYSSLLNLGCLERGGGYNCCNVVIRGKGTIASGGRVLAERVITCERERLKDYLDSHPEMIAECEKPETIPGRVRPRLINMSNCQNIVISGVELKNGASWNVHFIYSDHILTEGCSFYSEGVWNGDGWDPDSSTNCTIFGCTFHTGDDAIAIKSGKNPQGNEINRPTEHVRIFDCRCTLGHGIAVGSEMSGGISDVKIWDCDLAGSRCGIEIKGTKKRGGYVRNVQVRDCVTPRLLFHSVTYNDDGEGAPQPPVFEDCCFERLHILGEYTGADHIVRECDAMEFMGFDQEGYELQNILLRDIVVGTKGKSRVQKIALQYCRGITLEGICCL